MNLLEIKNLSVSFTSAENRRNTVVDGISFNIGANEIKGLVGESGSGKTVTALSILRILSREAVIDTGSVIFGSQDILTLPEAGMEAIRGKDIAMVFQEPFTSLNPVFTVGYQISEILSAHKKLSRLEADKEAKSLLEKVRIKEPERVFYEYPHRLSGGQRQRVGIAMAVGLKPKLLIADEPTTALDVTVQSEILKLLVSLKDEFKMSILFITHDFGIIGEIADNVIVMKDGKIVEEGRKSDILVRPVSAYTKELIEAVPKMGASKKAAGNTGPVFAETRKLTKTYEIEKGFFKRSSGKVLAVNNVSISVEAGSTVGLVGESGCGKSTLGRLLLGLEKPDSGSVLIDGRPYAETRERKIREIAQIVFQDPYSSLDPTMRMGEIVMEGAFLLGLNSGRRRELLKDVLSKARLSYQDRFKYPHQFSGGQRQRIAIARALAVKPRFIVLDEPVSSLDVIIQEGILELLEELKRKEALTYLFISHDLRVVESISDKVYVMYNGEIVESGTAKEIYEAPRHAYTKRLIDSIYKF